MVEVEESALVEAAVTVDTVETLVEEEEKVDSNFTNLEEELVEGTEKGIEVEVDLKVTQVEEAEVELGETTGM